MGFLHQPSLNPKLVQFSTEQWLMRTQFLGVLWDGGQPLSMPYSRVNSSALSSGPAPTGLVQHGSVPVCTASVHLYDQAQSCTEK